MRSARHSAYITCYHNIIYLRRIVNISSARTIPNSSISLPISASLYSRKVMFPATWRGSCDVRNFPEARDFVASVESTCPLCTHLPPVPPGERVVRACGSSSDDTCAVYFALRTNFAYFQNVSNCGKHRTRWKITREVWRSLSELGYGKYLLIVSCFYYIWLLQTRDARSLLSDCLSHSVINLRAEECYQ